MDYDKFSESSGGQSPLADRLNSALNIDNSKPETNRERQQNDYCGKASKIDSVNDKTLHDSENESSNDKISDDARTSVTETTDRNKQDSDKPADSECDLVNDKPKDKCNPIEEMGGTTECSEPDRDRKEDSSKSCDNGDQDDSDGDFVSEDSGSDVEYESADEGEEFQTDKQNLQELEDMLTDEQKEEKRMDAQTLKEEGNELFRYGSYKSALRIYSRALRTCPLKFPKDRAIMYSNRAACKMRLEDFEASIQDCTKALDLHPHYLKALMRRAELNEKADKLEEALADNQKIIELDPSQHSARAACMRLPDQIKERNEKLKEEMMGKLKDLGNMVLRPFGLSTNNFQMNQDPNSGGYSVNFVQNPQQNS